MSISQSEDLIRRLYEEVWNQGRLELVEQYIAEHHELNDPSASEETRGPAGYKRHLQRLITAIPDLHIHINEILSQEEKLVVNWKIAGTHRGALFGIPPTDKGITFSGVTIHRISEEKVVDSLVVWDALGLFQQFDVAAPLKFEKHAGSML